MSKSSGNSGPINPGINITPMIDVLLVLLIVFVVIVPAVPNGKIAPVPWEARADSEQAVIYEVLKIGGDQTAFTINLQEVTRQASTASLAAICANRARRVLFVKGDDVLSFNQIAEVIEVGHAAGVDRVGLITPRLGANL